MELIASISFKAAFIKFSVIFHLPVGIVFRNLWCMKFTLLCLLSLALVSCNTSIGIYRDMKQGFHWTKTKMQGSGGGGETVDPYGAPTY